jgi:hypothetical protein
VIGEGRGDAGGVGGGGEGGGEGGEGRGGAWGGGGGDGLAVDRTVWGVSEEAERRVRGGAEAGEKLDVGVCDEVESRGYRGLV